MKRLIGLVLVIVGGAGAMWGVASVLTGSSHARLVLGSDLSVGAMTGGFVGLAALTTGLIWVRD